MHLGVDTARASKKPLVVLSFSEPAVARANCPVAEKCRGCPLIHEALSSQRHRKLSRVRKLLCRVGLDVPVGFAADAPSAAVRYRNRLRFSVGPAGTAGLFNPNKDPNCAVAEASVAWALQRAIELSKERADLFSGMSHGEVRGRDSLGQVSLWLVPGAPTTAGAAELRDRQRALCAALGRGWVVGVKGADAPEMWPAQRYLLEASLHADVPLGTFLQVHHAMNRRLRQLVVSVASSQGMRSFFDACSGSGNLSLPLLAAGLRGCACEVHPAAAHALQRSARQQGFVHFSVSRSPVLESARSLYARGQQFDLVVCDPPRAGAKRAASMLARICRLALLMCSCNPRSFVADVLCAATAGLHLERVELLDMFPHTAHVELFGVLRRP